LSDIFLNGGAVMTTLTAGVVFQIIDPVWNNLLTRL